MGASLPAMAMMLLIVAAHPLYAADSALTQAKKNYAKLSQKIGDDYLAASAQTLKAYVSSVDAAMKRCQAEGDLDSVLALRAEKKRLAKRRAIPPKEVAGSSKVLAALIQAAEDNVSGADKRRIDQLRVLNQRYAEHLDRLKISLTKKGDIDGAVEVKKEKERLAAIAKKLEAQSIPDGKTGETAAKPPVHDGGTGAVPPAATSTQPCLSCKGTGKAYKDCPECSGQGTCSRCGGQGTFGVGLTGKPRKCLTCKATGRCRACDGKMKVATSGACPTCKGKGSVPRTSLYSPRPSYPAHAGTMRRPTPVTHRPSQQEKTAKLLQLYRSKMNPTPVALGDVYYHIGDGLEGRLFSSTEVLYGTYNGPPGGMNVLVNHNGKKIVLRVNAYDEAVLKKAQDTYLAHRRSKVTVIYGVVGAGKLVAFDIVKAP